MKLHIYNEEPLIDEILEIEPYNENRMSMRFIRDCKNDTEIKEELEQILRDLNCSIILKCGKLITVGTFKYNNLLSKYKYYYEQLTNKYFIEEFKDKLIKRHIENIIFDKKYFEEQKQLEISIENRKLHKAKLKYTRGGRRKAPTWTENVTYDLFNAHPVYYYSNDIDDIQYRSDTKLTNEELNAKHKEDIAERRAFNKKVKQVKKKKKVKEKKHYNFGDLSICT